MEKLSLPIPGHAPGPGTTLRLGQVFAAAEGLLLAELSRRWRRPLLVIAPGAQQAENLAREWRFFAPDLPEPLRFPDREVLPYDRMTPPQEATAQRLGALYGLPRLREGVCLTSVGALLGRLPPPAFLDRHAFVLAEGERLVPEEFRRRLIDAGYQPVAEVSEAGELAWRGGIIDLFPAGSPLPYRIELFDDEVESIRHFDPDNQRSMDRVRQVALLPAREVPVDPDAAHTFRAAFRAAFAGDPQRADLYRSVSQGRIPAGIEAYLPLFFKDTATLFDYLPKDAVIVLMAGLDDAMLAIRRDWDERHEERRHDAINPILPPEQLILTPSELQSKLAARPQVLLEQGPGDLAMPFAPPPDLRGERTDPFVPLLRLMDSLPSGARLLLAAESAGRREAVMETLATRGHGLGRISSWADFLAAPSPTAVLAEPLERGLMLRDERAGTLLYLISEAQIFGDRVFAQRRMEGAKKRNLEHVIQELGELGEGDLVTHEDYGIGRFKGLATPFADRGDVNEYVVLEYAGGDLLYLPVDSLDRIGRYVGNAAVEPALSRLGSTAWSKAKAKARQKAVDAAAELLDIYARRAARHGRTFPPPDDAYWDLVSRFPFEETADQQAAIDAVIADMISPQPMDRLVCGDVGFGKTEVALRAAFIAVHGGAQVAVLVPTTLLAQQHFETFRDRFADTPVRVEMLSRFRSAREQKATLDAVADGKVDILIGTHRLLQKDVRFKDLGLLILDEEHRFGVRQKDRIKALRAEVDILTLTATPIPRTLNLSLAGLRDLSIISTPPQRRQPVRTFVQVWDDHVVREACLRELRRGGQIYFLHNEVQSINRMADALGRLVPEARLRIAHGQMPEAELEAVMLDFYHQRFDLLLCTTIIESGIDNPHANTILIDRADRLGLAQLHQLRGRVGRSHQRAYAYLLTPDPRAMTPDAQKRLEAIQSLEDLGVGFALASHDLEIRGAGEILGESQSGHIDEVGFSLYMELLNDAVQAIRAGRDPTSLEEQRATGPEIHLNIPALIPADYLPDIHLRLQIYKRIAQADSDGLEMLAIEMVDRFGILPPPVKALLCQARLRGLAAAMGVSGIDAGPSGARLRFKPGAAIDAGLLISLIQSEPARYRLDGETGLRILAELGEGEARCRTLIELLERIRSRP